MGSRVLLLSGRLVDPVSTSRTRLYRLGFPHAAINPAGRGSKYRPGGRCVVSEYAMLKLPLEAIKEIDKRRGLLSRSNYVWSLLDGPDPARDQRHASATREELEDLQRWVRSLLRSFLDFTVTFGLELGIQPGKDSNHLLAELERKGRTNGTHSKRHDGEDATYGGRDGLHP